MMIPANLAWSCTMMEIFFEDYIMRSNPSLHTKFLEIYNNEFLLNIEYHIATKFENNFPTRKFIKILKKQTKQFIIDNEVEDIANISDNLLILFKLQVLN